MPFSAAHLDSALSLATAPFPPVFALTLQVLAHLVPEAGFESSVTVLKCWRVSLFQSLELLRAGPHVFCSSCIWEPSYQIG